MIAAIARLRSYSETKLKGASKRGGALPSSGERARLARWRRCLAVANFYSTAIPDRTLTQSLKALGKVREGEDAFANTRDACAPQRKAALG
jgi:hypothetical protein